MFLLEMPKNYAQYLDILKVSVVITGMIIVHWQMRQKSAHGSRKRPVMEWVCGWTFY